MKTCGKCNNTKPLSEFCKVGKNDERLRSHCTRCRTIAVRNYRKTGSTTINEFDGIRIYDLNKIYENLKIAYKLKGYSLSKRRLK